jgi:hypothetical protein
VLGSAPGDDTAAGTGKTAIRTISYLPNIVYKPFMAGSAIPNHEKRNAFLNVVAVIDTMTGRQRSPDHRWWLDPDYKPDPADVLEPRIGASSPWKNV